MGPAGCGKSVVLTERIKNLVEARNYDVNLKILVTTFNKDLINYLGDWIEQLLQEGRFKRTQGTKEKISYFTFAGSDQANIFVLHFDVLPTRLSLKFPIEINHKLHPITHAGDIEKYHLLKLGEIANSKVKDSKLSQKQIEKVAVADFLFDEYHRVLYGLQCYTYKQYKELDRVGRGNSPRLNKNSLKRKFVWDVINEYVRFLKKEKMDSFTIRRFRLLQNIKKHGFDKKFEYVFVDELQDCTDADFEIFYNLLANNNNQGFLIKPFDD